MASDLTVTVRPRRLFSELSIICPLPSNPIVIGSCFLIPYVPIQKLMSEGLIGAYFMRTTECVWVAFGMSAVVIVGRALYLAIVKDLIQLSNLG